MPHNDPSGFPQSEAPNSSLPKIRSVFDFTAEALEEVAVWLEQRGLTVPVSQVQGLRAPSLTIAQFRALNPYDGQTVYVNVDAVNNVVWVLRYNAASPLAYKWQFVGGTPVFVRYDTAENPGAASGVWANYANGPSATIDQAGLYQVDFGGHGNGNGSATSSLTGLSIASATPSVYVSHGWADAANAATSQQITVGSNTTDLRLQHQDADATRPISVSFRWLKVSPIVITQ